MALEALVARGRGGVAGGAGGFGERCEAGGGGRHVVAMGAVGQLRLDEMGPVGEFGEGLLGRIAMSRLPMDAWIFGT